VFVFHTVARTGRRNCRIRRQLAAHVIGAFLAPSNFAPPMSAVRPMSTVRPKERRRLPHSWTVHCGPVEETVVPDSAKTPSITSDVLPQEWIAHALESEHNDPTEPVWAPSWVSAMTAFGGDSNFRTNFKERPNTMALVAALLLTVSIPASLNPELREPPVSASPSADRPMLDRVSIIEVFQALMAISSMLSAGIILVASKTTDTLTIDLPSPKDAVWWWNTGLVNWPMYLLILDIVFFIAAYVVGFAATAPTHVVVPVYTASATLLAIPLGKLVYYSVQAAFRHLGKYNHKTMAKGRTMGFHF